MPLAIAPINVPLKIITVKGDNKTKRHLETLGLTKDTELTLLSIEGGSVILHIHESRLALDHKTAMSIVVEPV